LNTLPAGISFILEATLADRNSAYVERIHLVDALIMLSHIPCVREELNALGIKTADDRSRPHIHKAISDISSNIESSFSLLSGDEYLNALAGSSLEKLRCLDIEELGLWFGAAIYCCSSDNDTQSIMGKEIVKRELQYYKLIFRGLELSEECTFQEFINFSKTSFNEAVSHR
jgi:hypothetical protein